MIHPGMSAYNIIVPSEQPATKATGQVEMTMPATVAVAATVQAPVISSAIPPGTSGYTQVEKRANKCPQVSSSSFKQDRLGKLVAQSVLAYQRASSWSCYVCSIRNNLGSLILYDVSTIEPPRILTAFVRKEPQCILQVPNPPLLTYKPDFSMVLTSLLSNTSTLSEPNLLTFANKGSGPSSPLIALKIYPTYESPHSGWCHNIAGAPI